MNYISSFLNWSHEPSYTPPHDTATAAYHRSEYVSPLSALQKVDCSEEPHSQPSSLASAFFSGWSSSSSHPHHTATGNVSHNLYTPYSSQQPYDLPSITSQHQHNVIIVPTSHTHPSAAISVTASPPPPLMHENSYHTAHQTVHNKRHSGSVKNQIKFTPKYKKRRSQTHNNDSDHVPLVLPSHSASQHRPLDDDTSYNANLGTIAESRTASPMKTHCKNSSTLMDALQLQLEDTDEGEAMKRLSPVYTPPPRAPMVPFRPTSPIAGMDGAEDGGNPPFQYQSVTESVHSAEEMADACTDSDCNLMVSLLTDYGDDTSTTATLRQATPNHSNHLLPLQQQIGALPHLPDANEEDNETNEVNLHYSYNNNTTPNDDTNSVVSDFEEAGVWLEEEKTKSTKNRANTKIRVTCNNCYLWRHHTNKLEIDLRNVRTRTTELEQSINVAEDNVQFSQQHYGELKQENQRLKDKTNDLKREITQQTQEATDALILVRKQKETETQESHKQYQHLMKQKNELESSYNEQVNRCNDKEAEIERYKTEVQGMRLKHERLHDSMQRDKSAWNGREKEMKHALDEMTDKYLNVETRYKECALQISELNEECKRLKAEIDTDTAADTDTHQRIELDEWKSKYGEMSRALRECENSLNAKLISYKTLHEKHEQLMADMAQYKEKNESLCVALRASENECSELRQCVKDLEARLLSMRHKSDAQRTEREEQLKQSNQENDQLMDQNYELNEKLNKHIEEMDACRQKTNTMKREQDEYNEKLEILSGKLDAAVAERDKQLKKNVRLNNQVKSLQNQVKSYQDSIHHLESVIDDTYGLAEDKERMLSHLKRKNNENQLNLDTLKKRMKKHERQQTSYRQIEVDQISKSRRKMDQKMNNLRKSNVNLQNENEELHSQIKELKRDIHELQRMQAEIKTKFKSSVSKYESNLSQMTANNHQIMSHQINLKAQLESTKEEHMILMRQMEGLQTKYDEMESMQRIHIRCSCGVCDKVNVNRFEMVEMETQMRNDSIYQFMTRCRNIFINTNRLTPKLMMQLIESCHRSIVMFYETKAKFAHFITKCQTIHQRFNNLQQSIRAKYTRTGVLKPQSQNNGSNTPTLIRRHPKGGRERASSSFSDLKRTNGFPNIDFAISKTGKQRKSGKVNKKKNYGTNIRRPIQERKAPHIEAYNEIYLLLLESISSAKHDMEAIDTQMYDEAMDYSLYNDHENENEIDWDRLSIDPSSERRQSQERMENNERFATLIQNIQTSTKELRMLHAKSSVELNVSYLYLVDPEVYSSDLEMDSEYFELMKKVNKSGPNHKKRFSINS